ncbi:metalloendopeptidase [Elysia marginata]|uniref:Metalloendopeptidase n=1 Tax=Elysia marginata TaxID=1093978 RepID=A0AAV4JXZ7_9GAST|nr:metalloendopeptidase [Elysia marginata]
MRWILELFSVACLTLLAELTNAARGGKKHMSIDKQIMDAAPDAGMFDVFHMMPGGDFKVMTELDILLTLDQYKRLRGKRQKVSSGPGRGRANGNRNGRRNGNQNWRRSRLVNRRRGSAGRQKRKADQDESLLWTDCKVYYEVDESFTTEDMQTLETAISEWTSVTCLEFIKSSTATSRVQFKNGAGCYSMIGMQPEPQVVALAPTCRTKGIIAHEIGHAIGWYHEHMRPDRDSFVSINFDAIPPRYHINFDKYTNDEINDHDVQYDYTSLMHYGNDALPGSIVALDPSFQDKMGQREGLSFKDIKLANIMYDCANIMGCTQRTCDFDGFQLYKSYKGSSSCQCWCDSGDVSDPLILCSELDSAPPKPSIRPTETPVVDLCRDVRSNCPELKAKGDCMSKLSLMMDICKQTCGFCGTGEGGGPEPCMDHDKGCPMMAAAGLCTTLEPVMEKQCPASCNLCPSPPDPCQIQKQVMALAAHYPNGTPRLTSFSLLTVIVSVVAVLHHSDYH